MVWVRGDLSIYQPYGHIHLALDGKSADTRYEMLRYESEKNQTLARVRIHTGRCHQIRCHFAMIGYPVMGDPRYGQGNKNQEGLQLVAYSLAFQCPYGRGRIKVEIDPEALGLV